MMMDASEEGSSRNILLTVNGFFVVTMIAIYI